MTTALLIRAVRRRRGLSQQQLADEIGLSRSSVANAEAGRQDLPSSVVLPLLEREGLLITPGHADQAVAALARRLDTVASLLQAAESEVAESRRQLSAIRAVLNNSGDRS